jgi:hypothetical protein
MWEAKYLTERHMGLKAFSISDAREALEVICDGTSHGDRAPMAWIDGGSPSGSALLITTVGWSEAKHKGVTKWLCPRCSDLKRSTRLS